MRMSIARVLRTRRTDGLECAAARQSGCAPTTREWGYTEALQAYGSADFSPSTQLLVLQAVFTEEPGDSRPAR
eukprot:COSAG02_NODE_3266_length_7057_cov_12.370078_7_plen_73_part_00